MKKLALSLVLLAGFLAIASAPAMANPMFGKSFFNKHYQPVEFMRHFR